MTHELIMVGSTEAKLQGERLVGCDFRGVRSTEVDMRLWLSAVAWAYFSCGNRGTRQAGPDPGDSRGSTSAFDPQQTPGDQLRTLLPCYQDRETVRMVDGPNAEPYDLDKLRAMFQYMSEHGELYVIERLIPDRGWIPIGDAGLQVQATPIVLSPDHRGQGIGRAVIEALIERARVLGWQSVEVSEIYDYNVASRRMYESLGFAVVEGTELGHRYRLALS